MILMIRASIWQWDRHKQKEVYIASMQQRLLAPVQDLQDLLSQNSNLSELLHRRAWVKGNFDFAHEILIRNRKLDDMPGTHVLTPLKLENSDLRILVNRGFIPLAFSDKNQRHRFQREAPGKIPVLLKESAQLKWLAPADPPAGPPHPWVDAWLRPNLPEIQKQMPYQILSIYGELMPGNQDQLKSEDLISDTSGREELLVMGLKSINDQKLLSPEELRKYPLPAHDTVISPGRHFGYVFEWAFMALMTFLIGVVLQLKR